MSKGVKYYAYIIDDIKNITTDWDICKEKVKGKKSKYKSFKTKQEAELWLNSNGTYSVEEYLDKDGIYFDAVTGRGIGTEVRVSDYKGSSLIPLLLEDNLKFKNFLKTHKYKYNEYGNILLGTEKTNNYGELFGLWLAMEIAKLTNKSKIYGDSQLVIFYWSKGFFHEDKLENETVKLIKKVIENREKYNIEIHKISGDINPADLGFHK